jgi:hypothetical protein
VILMTDVRYTGNSAWTRVVLGDDGKWTGKYEVVKPGEVVTVDDDVAERFLQGPADRRLFVAAGSSEDPESKDYVRVRSVGDGGNPVIDPGQDLGSTTPDGRVIYRTEDDNEEGFSVAPPETGPQSDNARLYEEDEINAKADEAKAKARESRSAKRPSGSGGGSAAQQSSGSGAHHPGGDR